MEKKVKEALLNSGYFEGRSIDISEIKKVLEEEKYILFDKGEEALKKYGMLNIDFIVERKEYNERTIKMDPIWVATGQYRNVVGGYEKYIGQKLIPLGYDGHLSIFISESGEIFGGFDDFLTKLGEDFEDALYNFIIVRRYDSASVDSVEEYD